MSPSTGLPALDWQAAWLVDWQAVALPVVGSLRAGVGLHDALNAANTCAMRFVPQSALPPDLAYEAFIAKTKSVPTRENLHDALNALAWIRFPATKTALHELQVQGMQAHGLGPTRGPLRDAATVFDENGAVLVGEGAEEVWQALAERRWLDALHKRQAAWLSGRLRVLLFGHALLEKLQAPRLAIVAHVLALPQQPATDRDLDAQIAQALTQKLRSPAQAAGAKPFAPLPVLGIPGWHPENGHAAFYANTEVFRPARSGIRWVGGIGSSRR